MMTAIQAASFDGLKRKTVVLMKISQTQGEVRRESTELFEVGD